MTDPRCTHPKPCDVCLTDEERAILDYLIRQGDATGAPLYRSILAKHERVVQQRDDAVRVLARTHNRLRCVSGASETDCIVCALLNADWAKAILAAKETA